MRFPSIINVAAAVRACAREVDWQETTGEEAYCDVRLQVYPDGAWAVRFGLSDYDLDHRGYWGASSFPRGRFDARTLARDLIEQAKNDHACSLPS